MWECTVICFGNFHDKFASWRSAKRNSDDWCICAWVLICFPFPINLNFSHSALLIIVCSDILSKKLIARGTRLTNKVFSLFFFRKDAICHENKDCTNSACRSCINCSKKTCSPCWDKHPCGNKSFTPISYDQNSSCYLPWCTEHKTDAKFICLDCRERFVCMYCVHREHKDHENELIVRYAPDTRNWLTSQINVQGSHHSNVSYDEEMIKIESYRTELEQELQDRVVKQLSNYIDRLNQEKEVLLNNFDTTVSRHKENIANSKLLGANIGDPFTELNKEMKSKQDFEILSEKSAIVKKIDTLSMVHCFKVDLDTNYNDQYILGQLNVKTVQCDASENKSGRIPMKHIYENKIEKENDLKSVTEYVSGK